MPGFRSRMSHPLCLSSVGPMYFRTSSAQHHDQHLPLIDSTTALGGNIPHRSGLTICVLAYERVLVLKSISAGKYPLLRTGRS